MASTQEYRDFILDMLSELDGVRVRAMMGEYLLYYQDRLVGGIYDNRLLVKPVPAAVAYVTNAIFEPPYPGAKDMLLVDNLDNRRYLTGLLQAMYAELPAPKSKSKNWLFCSLSGRKN